MYIFSVNKMCSNKMLITNTINLPGIKLLRGFFNKLKTSLKHLTSDDANESSLYFNCINQNIISGIKSPINTNTSLDNERVELR